jgi:thiol-disulfide isomerase/thioredoxin
MFGNSGSYHKRVIAIAALLLGFAVGLHAAGAIQSEASKAGTATANAPRPGQPVDPKARKTYASAQDWEKHGQDGSALDDYRKANKQDGGHCWDCLSRAYMLAMKLGMYKDAADIVRDWLPQAQTDAEKAALHFGLAFALQQQGIQEKKDKYLLESNDEFKTALELNPNLSRSHYELGVTLARLHQDEAAKTQFAAFLDQDRKNPTLHPRAERFLDRVELARATMAPPFFATTLDGQHISMDSLAGKVVLIDFWATWCGPCREALPHIQKIARKFDGQPFVVLSISLDNDEAKWKDFVTKNEMTWLQYRDGGFDGQISKQFGVTAIPATFTIDADGVLEDQHVGDADIEGKLKKLIARAVEISNRKPEPTTTAKAPDGGN